MKLHTSPQVMRRRGQCRGMTLLEITVILITLISLISIFYVGARSWMRSSDRTACILSIRNVQVATRSYQNIHGYDYGSQPSAELGTQNIAEHLFLRGYIEQRTYDEIEGNRTCPAGGDYHCPTPDVFPPLGSVYLHCSLGSDEKHAPSAPDSW